MLTSTMTPRKRTPLQRHKDKLYQRTKRANRKEELAKASARKKTHAISQKMYKLRMQSGAETAPRPDQTTSLFGSAPSTSFSFSSDKASCTPTPPRMVPATDAPKTAPPALAATPMTSQQQYNLAIMEMQAKLYENTNAKLAVGFETVTAIAGQMRLNCKEGVDALGTSITKLDHDQDQE